MMPRSTKRRSCWAVAPERSTRSSPDNSSMACMIGPPVCPAAGSIWRPPTPRRAWVGPWTPRRAGYPSLVVDRLREECLGALGTAGLNQRRAGSFVGFSPRKPISMNRQPLLIAASRCYLIQMLRSAMTCTNGCSCWSPDERNSPPVFPYHGTTGNRCADRRLRRSRPTVGVEVIGSLSLKLCVLLPHPCDRCDHAAHCLL